MVSALGLPPKRTWLPAAVAFLLTVTGSPWADAARQLPKEARYGQVNDFRHPYVAIDKRTFRLAPGAKIYSQQNLVIVPSAMPGRAYVLYELDIRGQISGLWLLTADEAARYRRSPAGSATGRD